MKRSDETGNRFEWQLGENNHQRLRLLSFTECENMSSHACTAGTPENTRRWSNVGLTLAHRLRRWSSVSPTLDLRLVFAGTRMEYIIFTVSRF